MNTYDDEDEELQKLFEEKKLLPGLNLELPEPKKYVNNKEGLKRKYDELYLHMDWSERLDITIPKAKIHITQDEPDKLVDNDFKREKSFFLQAQEAAIEGIKKLHSLGISTRRPDDYFAQMSKSDTHMKKVKESILSKHAELETREKVRKLRDLKKHAKEVQREALQRKQTDKKTFNAAVNKIKKTGVKDGFDIATLTGSNNGEKKKTDRQQGKTKEAHEKKDIRLSKKQKFKDNKYGFGGKKKRSKYNTADSSADISGFNGKIHHKKDKFKKNSKPNTKFVNKNKPKRKFKK